MLRTSPALAAMLLLLAVAGASADGPVPNASGRPNRPGPAEALAASAVYPGLGQLLNGAEPKAAVVGGAEAFLIARLVLEDRWTRHALRLYRETGRSEYFEEYSEHFDRRQTLVWWVVVAALYCVVDAYVDAHLTGFDDALPPYLAEAAAGPPGRECEGVGVALTFRF